MQEINKEITDMYGIEIKSIVPFKDASLVTCDKGRKVLKKTDLTPDRILFIHEAKEHLIKNNFSNIDRYLCTLEGEPYVTIGENRYYIIDFVEGRECNFDSKADTAKAAAMLGAFHKATKGFVQPHGSRSKDDLGKLPCYFVKRLDEIKKLKKIAKRGKSRFDYLFLQYVDYFYALGENSISSLASSKYSELVENTRSQGIFCHHDYTHNNIIFNESGTWVINFDYCCFELKIYDIANLIRRKMRKCYWNVDDAKTIIEEYRRVEDICNDEIHVMKIMLQFPQKFWRVANKYYNSRRSWSEKSYVSRLQEVIDELEHHKKFMESYDSIF